MLYQYLEVLIVIVFRFFRRLARSHTSRSYPSKRASVLSKLLNKCFTLQQLAAVIALARHMIYMYISLLNGKHADPCTISESPLCCAETSCYKYRQEFIKKRRM